MNRSFSILTTLLVLGVAACDKPGAETQQKTDNAQAAASTEVTNAEVTADQKTNQAQAEAQKKIAGAQHDFESTREDYRHKMQTNLDDVDKKLDELDAKAKTATGNDKAELLSKSTTLRRERDAFASDFASIKTVGAADWDVTKTRLDKEWSSLKDNVDKAM